MVKKYVSDCEVIANEALNTSYFCLTVRLQDNVTILPGQFVELKVEGSTTTFLRRPISIHDVDEHQHTVRLLINRVGDGTRRLASLQPGDNLNMVYPLGNGFTLLTAGKKALLVGGGVGIAPLLYLGRILHEQGVEVSFLLGFRSTNEMIDLAVYRQFGSVYITTEDGSEGKKGFVTAHDCLKAEYDRIYVCGPTPMMKAVAASAECLSVDCEVSLENKMACGVGACLCCVTETQEGHKCVCSDGPVFNVRQLKWSI